MKAFPSPYAVDEHGGMDLRDYFAAKAMQSLITIDLDSDFNDVLIAQAAYEVADAMLKARRA